MKKTVLPEEIEGTRRAMLIRQVEKKWTNNTEILYYYYRGKSPYADTKNNIPFVEKAFKGWTDVGIGLKFKEVKDIEDSMIRIGFLQGDGAWSYIGRDNLTISMSDRTMNFGWDLRADGRGGGVDTPLHEIGHMLGFSHEHQNPNAGIDWNEEAVYERFGGPPNNWPRDRVDHNILNKLSPDKVDGSGWDPDSIMSYGFGGGLIDSPEQYRGGFDPKDGLSETDKEQVRNMYPPPIIATVLVHLQNIGDQQFKLGEWAGTKGENRRLEGFEISNLNAGLKLEYMAHLQGSGDTEWTSDFVGTRGFSRRLEGFAIRMTGASADNWSVKYKAHLQNTGDTESVMDGTFVGTRGQSRYVEAIFVEIVPKRPVVRVHLQNIGDQQFKLGEWAGTKGENRRLEGFEISNLNAGLKLEYMAHLQGSGDTEWTSDFVGTRGFSRRLEGFAIRMTGASADNWSVKYKAHLQNTGDTESVMDGTFVGTRGQSRYVEAIFVEIVLKEKYQDLLRLSATDKKQVRKEMYPPGDIVIKPTLLGIFQLADLDFPEGSEKDFLIKPTFSGMHIMQTIGAIDSLMVLNELRGSRRVFIKGNDDSGRDKNALIDADLRQGREYVLTVRLIANNFNGGRAAVFLQPQRWRS